MKRPVLLMTVMLSAVGTLALTAFWRAVPLLVWNASASVPAGLYAVRPTHKLIDGELVVAMPPEPLANFLEVRHYLPKGLPLIKHVAALPGQQVCRVGSTVSIDGLVRATARRRDHAGRMLPTWSGCQIMVTGQVFLLNARQPASLDGRYFGPVPSSSVIGRAVPLWTTDRR